MPHYKVVVKRTAVLTTKEIVEAENYNEAMYFVQDNVIDTGELGSIESWVEELHRDWTVEDYKDVIKLIEAL